MPPQNATPPLNPPNGAPTKPRTEKKMGPMFGIFIIVILLVFGGLYFWGAHLNQQAQQEQLPFIPGDAQQ